MSRCQKISYVTVHTPIVSVSMLADEPGHQVRGRASSDNPCRLSSTNAHSRRAPAPIAREPTICVSSASRRSFDIGMFRKVVARRRLALPMTITRPAESSRVLIRNIPVCNDDVGLFSPCEDGFSPPGNCVDFPMALSCIYIHTCGLKRKVQAMSPKDLFHQ